MNWKDIKTWTPIIGTIAALCIIAWLSIYNKNINEEYKRAVNNNKAFIEQLDSVNNKCVVYQTTVDELYYMNDSITNKLLATAKDLKVKDKRIKQLNYMATEIKKVDTVTFRDTIFRDPSIKIDTNIGDKWVNTHLVFTYPNKITVSPKVVSEKQVVFYTKKETVQPPKKFFLCRWFQKKHTIIKADVIEENPYISSEKNTFYQIVD